VANTRPPFRIFLHLLDRVICRRRGPPALLLQRRLQFPQKRSCGEAGALSASVQYSILVSRRGCQWTYPHQQAEEGSYADSDTPGGVIRRSLVTWLRGQADMGGTTL
jgi:hypothetical protein